MESIDRERKKGVGVCSLEDGWGVWTYLERLVIVDCPAVE